MNKMEGSILTIGLIGILLSVLFNQLSIIGIIALLPFALLGLHLLLNNPIIGLYYIFTLNYFIMPIFRYTNGSGLSILMDILFILTFIFICISHVYQKNIPWKQIFNGMFFATLIWLLYCIVEIVNPHGVFEAWTSTRMLVIHTFACVLLTSLLCTKFQTVKILILLLSIFTLLAIIKVFIQKFIGFDSIETRWLNNGGARTHIIWSGIRYFSFFTDASNFGSNMGFSGSLFLILAGNIQRKPEKIYYFIISILSFYAMFLSGTRGAMIIPLAALALYCVASKKIKAIIFTATFLMFVYIFFAMTNIGNGNPQIRRMRTAFKPTQDASYMVRMENRAKLSAYMKDKIFGVGLGMAGGNSQKYSNAYTTTIATDSWFVMIWIQAGIVGLTLYICILLYGVGHGTYIAMFRVKDQELKGVLTALTCSTFGFLGSAYSTDSFGQFPCHIMTFMFLTICLKGELYQQEIKTKEIHKLDYKHELE